MNQKLSMKKAALINIGSKYIVVILQLVYSAILARILTPEDYGIIAIITVFVSFFALLSDFGVGNAIIQNQELSKKDVNSIFSWSIYTSILLAVIFLILSYPISLIYKDNVYLKIGPLLSIAVLFSAFNMVPNALLLKRKKFIVVGIRQVFVCLISSIIAIFLALAGAKYYALVAYSIINSILNFIWNMYGSGLEFRFKVDSKSINKVKSFSSYLLSFNIINYFSRNLDKIIIGKFIGNVEVGYYNKAYQLMLYPMNNFTNVITPVLLPFLAEYQNNKEYIYDRFIKVVKLLSLLGVYITVFAFFCSYELVIILYGNQWSDTVNCFRYLSISIWSQMICATSGSMFQILNQTKRQFRRGVISTITTVGCIMLGVLIGGIEEISIFVTIAYLINFITMLIYLVKQTFEKSYLEFLKKLVPEIFIAIIVGISLFELNNIQFNNVYISFSVKLIISGFVYLISIICFKQFKYFNIIIPKKFRRKIYNNSLWR